VPRVPRFSHECRTIGSLSGVSFTNYWSRRLESCVLAASVMLKEHPTFTDTTLTIRCPYCMAGRECRPMIAHKDGRFVCRDCAHTVRPGVLDYRCTCLPCLRLSRTNQMSGA